MVVFKNYLVDQLPEYIQKEDSYQVSGKGFVVRYLEIFGEEIDDELYYKIEAILDNLSPLTAEVKYLDYFAVMLGDIERLIDSEHDYRRFLTYLLSIYRIKGTKKSYLALLRTLGMETTVTELDPPATEYDDPAVLYNGDFFYDTSCPTCSDYELTITGPAITGELFRRIGLFVELLEPINARLSKITYNGDEIAAVFIEVTIDVNGDLIYDNTNDPGLVLTLVNGDLIISGPNEDRYFIDSNGDLYYVL